MRAVIFEFNSIAELAEFRAWLPSQATQQPTPTGPPLMPTTADGKPITMGMKLFDIDGVEVTVRGLNWMDILVYDGSPDGDMIHAGGYYSTPDAAQVAKAAFKAKTDETQSPRPGGTNYLDQFRQKTNTNLADDLLKWVVYLALNNSFGNPVRVTVDNDGDDPHGLDSK